MKYIELTQGKYAIVNDEDYEFLNKFSWCYAAGYAKTDAGWGYGRIYMHQMIMKPQRGDDTDHINHNKLDNRRENLRICTRSQNKQNQPKRADNTSGYKGVSWDKKYGKYKAYIKADGVLKHLGMYYKTEDAARAYNRAAKIYFGDFACLNDIPEKTFALPS